MSVRVRLTRVGSKKNPVWRVVVADQRSPRDGRIIESIGHYNPQTEPSTIVIDRDRLRHWIDQGAQPTNTVKKLMRAPDTVPEPKAAPPPPEPTPKPEASPETAEAAPETAEAAPETAEAAPEPDVASTDDGEAGTVSLPDAAGDAEPAPEGDTAPAGTAGSESEAGPSGAAIEPSEAEQPPSDAEADAPS